jgi:hypothetical protein
MEKIWMKILYKVGKYRFILILFFQSEKIKKIVNTINHW